MLGERFNETSNCDAVGQFHSLKKLCQSLSMWKNLRN